MRVSVDRRSKIEAVLLPVARGCPFTSVGIRRIRARLRGPDPEERQQDDEQWQRPRHGGNPSATTPEEWAMRNSAARSSSSHRALRRLRKPNPLFGHGAP